jgi:intein-encoded DNA endonuclease-like protein
VVDYLATALSISEKPSYKDGALNPKFSVSKKFIKAVETLHGFLLDKQGEAS